MSDTASIGWAQREFWNSDATRRWVTEQAHIDRLFAHLTDAALTAAAPTCGASDLVQILYCDRSLGGHGLDRSLPG